MRKKPEEELLCKVSTEDELRVEFRDGVQRSKKKDKARIENRRRLLSFTNISRSFPLALGCLLVIIV
jgi:hypothetical protein